VGAVPVRTHSKTAVLVPSVLFATVAARGQCAQTTKGRSHWQASRAAGVATVVHVASGAARGVVAGRSTLTARAVPPCIQTGTLEIAGEPKIVSLDSSAGTTASNSVPSRSYGGAPRRDSSRRSPLKFLVGESRSAGGKRDDSTEAPPTAASGGFMRPALCPRTGSQAGGVLTLKVSRGNMTMTCACDSWRETEKRSRSGVPGWVRDPDGCTPAASCCGTHWSGPGTAGKGLEVEATLAWRRSRDCRVIFTGRSSLSLVHAEAEGAAAPVSDS
jgi:hypothetical protein